MPHFHFSNVRSLVRAACALAIVTAAIFALLNRAGNVGAQTAAATTTPVATVTPTATTATTSTTANAATSAAAAAAASTSATTSTTSGAFAAGQAVVVNVDSLNVRASASINATVNTQFIDGTWGTIVSGPVDAGDGHAWYQITVDGTSGWVDGAFLADAASAAATLPVGTTAIVTGDTLNLRANPTLSGAVVSTLIFGDSASVTAASQTADGHVWYQLNASGTTGWAVRDFLAFAPSNISSVVTGGSAVVNTDVVVLRDSSSTTGAKLADLVGGTTLTVLAGPTAGTDGDWYQVSDGTTTGWVAGDYLRVV